MVIRRHSRLRRLSIRLLSAGLLTFALLLAVRLAWGWEAAARLTGAQRQLAATIIPAQRPSDGTVLSDDRNAAVMMIRAIRSIHIDGFAPPAAFSPGEGRMPFFYRGFGPSASLSYLRPLLAENAEALRLIDGAAAMPEARWPAVVMQPRWSAFGAAPFGENFPLRWLLRAAAESDHEQHNVKAVIADLERLLGVARIFDASLDLASHVAAAAMRSEAAAAIERWNLATDILPPAAREEARRLLAALLAQGAAFQPIAASFDQETASYERSTLDALPALHGWWLRPMALDAFARRLSLQMQLMPIAHAANWPQVQSISLPPDPRVTNLDLIVMLFSEPRLDIADTMRIYFQSLTDIRAGSILLAANLYRSDHGGYPADLSALLPNYLPAPPVDPFDGAAKPMRYRLDTAGPTVWSVGENGIDEDAATGTAAIPGFGFARRHGQPDIVYGAAWRAAMSAAPSPFMSRQ